MTGMQRGQATVELALSLPLIALVLAAVVETGLVVGDQARLWHAAREAARVAVVDPDQRAAVEAAARSGLEGIEVSIDPPSNLRVVGKPLTVELSYRPRGRIPLIGELVPLVDLHARAVMRIERP